MPFFPFLLHKKLYVEGRGGIWELCIFTQFFCKYKAPLKKLIYFF